MIWVLAGNTGDFVGFVMQQLICFQEVELEEDGIPQDLIAACKHQTTQLYDMMKDNSNTQTEDCMC